MFGTELFIYSDKFVNGFISIMNSFKMVRNKICHNEPIYNFEGYFYDVYEFLNQNNIHVAIKHKRVKFTIHIVIECLELFSKSNNYENNNLKRKIRKAYETNIKSK